GTSQGFASWSAHSSANDSRSLPDLLPQGCLVAQALFGVAHRPEALAGEVSIARTVLFEAVLVGVFVDLDDEPELRPVAVDRERPELLVPQWLRDSVVIEETK